MVAFCWQHGAVDCDGGGGNGEAGKRLTEAGEAAGWRLTGVEAVPETRRPTVGFKPRVSRKTDGDDVGLTERCLMHSGWIVCR